jgi:hypothetical protein
MAAAVTSWKMMGAKVEVAATPSAMAVIQGLAVRGSAVATVAVILTPGEEAMAAAAAMATRCSTTAQLPPCKAHCQSSSRTLR